MNYLISVIIPYYNNSDKISETLDSLIEQTKSLHEIIIIDDSSDDSDKLKDIVSEYSEELPLKLFRNKENKNGAYSRNKGIIESTGNVIAFLDADDLWVSNKVERMIDELDKYDENNIFFSKVNISVDGNIVGSRPRHFNPNIHISEYLFLEDGFIQTSGIFCSRKIAKKILFQEKFKRHQDYDFVLRAAHEGYIFKYINEELATYSSDMKVNLSKGEGYLYSRFWLNEMKPYFSKSGFKGFEFFNLTARLLAEKRYFKAILNIFKSFFRLNFKDYLRIYPKFMRIIKERIISK